MRLHFVLTALVAACLLGWQPPGQAQDAEPEQSPVWTVLEPVKTVSAKGANFTKQPDGSMLMGGTNPLADTYTITANTNLKSITAIRLEVLPSGALPSGGPGRAFNGNFVLTAFRVVAAPRLESTKSVPVVFHRATADYSQPGFSITGLSDANPTSHWAVHPLFGKKHGAVFEAKAPFGFAQGTILTFTLGQDSAHPQHTIGCWRLSVTTAKPPVPLDLLELSAKEMASAWADLAGPNADTAQRAIEALAASRQTVVFLKARLKHEVFKGDLRRVAILVKELDHNKFSVRERATAELEKLGPLAAPALAQVVLETKSMEARRRAVKLLEKVRSSSPLLREQRGVEVLVRMGTSDARQLLERLAKGPGDAWLTQQAKAGLQRLSK
jgi:hypothetical protein